MSADDQRLIFIIHGMDCAEEVSVLKRELVPLLGEERLAFDVLNGKLFVEAGLRDISADEIIERIAATGMRAELWTETDGEQSDMSLWQVHGRSILTAVSGVFGLLGLLTHAWILGGFTAAFGSEGMGITQGVPLPAIVLYLIGITCGVWHVLPKAWRAAIGLRPDMNLLITVAVVGAAGRRPL